jgi:hypothetical protein
MGMVLTGWEIGTFGRHAHFLEASDAVPDPVDEISKITKSALDDDSI